MPAPARLVGQLARRKASESFICPSCAFRAFLPAPRPARRKLELDKAPFRRHGSTITSATTINAPLDVPVAFRELHDALTRLKSDAGVYVSLSRLQLALRGLEGENPVTRVAVLSSDSQQLAKRLAKLLAADPLNQATEWEKQLQEDTNDGRTVLIRHGDPTTPLPSNPLLKTIVTTSPFLQSHNLELLLSTIDISSPPSSHPSEFSSTAAADALLVPHLETRSSPTHTAPIALPVHKTLLLGATPSTLVDYGRYTASTPANALPPSLLKLAITIPTHRAAPEQDPSAPVVAVDADLASSALQSFRQSFDNAVRYERGWFASGLGCLAEWIGDGTELAESGGELKPVVRRLVSSVLDAAERKIAVAEAQSVMEGDLAGKLGSGERRALLLAMEGWAESAHGELQGALEEAWESKGWKRLAWWKLFWRVDDVAVGANEVLERGFLVDAEKGLIFLAGRCEQAGLEIADAALKTRPTMESKPKEEEEEQDGKAIWDTTLPTQVVGDLYTEKEKRRLLRNGKAEDEEAIPAPKAQAWPTTIAGTRARLSRETVPPLQALAQTLVLQAYSTTFLTSAISALAYVGVSTISLYEASVVAAFGLVWAAGNVQRRWERARGFWKGEVREEGRLALGEVEGRLREVIESGGKVKEDGEGKKEREKARVAVRRVREALKDVSGER